MQREVWFNERWIETEGEKRSQIGKSEETIGDAFALDARPPELQERAGGAEGEEWKADPKAEREEDGRNGVFRTPAQIDGAEGPIAGEGDGDCKKDEMTDPLRMAREPMRVGIGAQQSRLEEDEAGDPHRRRAAKNGQ